MSTRLRSALALLAVLAASLSALPAYAEPAPAVPDAIRVPDDQVLLFRAFASGTQNYACDAATGAWTFKQPKAVLTSDSGDALGIHGRGPFWAAYDGSRVVGSTAASAPSNDSAQDVPLLLLRATPGDTDGQMAHVSFIQRLDTRGGTAPSGTCDPAEQPSVAVPYVAVYYFYGPSTSAAAGAMVAER